MIIFLDKLGARTTLRSTICVVGAGAAGITLAREFDGNGFSVLLLEAGGLRLDASVSDEHYRGSAVAPHPSPSQFRKVAFGGTTGIWGGRCVPFDPIDFEKRDYIANSGWPVSYNDIAKYYPRAMSYCDAGAFDFTVSNSLKGGATNSSRPESLRPTIPGLGNDSVILTDRIERYSLPTNFGKRYRVQIERSENITALLNARCIALNRRTGENRIESVSVVDPAGNRYLVEAEVFVLAVGGIEAARLLMASDPQGPGLGNHSDNLGRFYTCHFENTLGRLVPSHGKVAFDFEKTLDGVYCRRKLLFSPEAQRSHHLRNIAFRLHFPPYSDAAHGSSVLSTIYLAKSSLISEYRAIMQHGDQGVRRSSTLAHLCNIATDLPSLGYFTYQWLFQRHFATRKLPYTLIKNRDGSYPVEFNSEQTPLASNRITLTDEVDRDGLKRVHIDWRLHEEDAQAAQRALLLLKTVLQQQSFCRLEFEEEGLLAAICRSVPLGGHHIGTTRMAATERGGVVDRNCAIFEFPNLFVASSAVFCTSSHANPTLTIVAMALRLAEYLNGRLRANVAVNDRSGESIISNSNYASGDIPASLVSEDGCRSNDSWTVGTSA